MKNKVILVGSEHHNGLGLVRQFGVNGIKPYGIIVTDNLKWEFVHHSKYWEKVWIVKKEDEALDILFKEFVQEDEKPVIIPWSDGMAALIDNNYENLFKNFIIPSIANKGGMICELMDKQKQLEFCKKSGLRMLESQICVLDNQVSNIKSTVKFPVILKPVESIEGEKLDIQVCNNSEELENSLTAFKKKRYKRILIQEYLEERIEYVLTGAVCGELQSFTLVSHIRQWPQNTGSGSFSIFDVSEDSMSYARSCLNILAKEGYCGNIDIEIFRDKDNNFYINELNWRCSGRNFVSLYTEIYSAYQYYNKVVGDTIDGCLVNNKEGYTMNEATDLRHVFFEKMPLGLWLSDLKKVNSFALWDRRDIQPTVMRYLYLLKKMILKK